jgi:hypothetical protein
MWNARPIVTVRSSWEHFIDSPRPPLHCNTHSTTTAAAPLLLLPPLLRTLQVPPQLLGPPLPLLLPGPPQSLLLPAAAWPAAVSATACHCLARRSPGRCLAAAAWPAASPAAAWPRCFPRRCLAHLGPSAQQHTDTMTSARATLTRTMYRTRGAWVLSSLRRLSPWVDAHVASLANTTFTPLSPASPTPFLNSSRNDQARRRLGTN